MEFRRRGRGRRSAVVERRFKVSRMAAVALGAVKRPKNACFFLLIGALFFTAGPLMRYVKEHRYFALSEVDVRGTERLEVSGVRSWLGMVEGSSIWNASPRALEENLRGHPAIAAAHVRRVLPGRLEVEIEEREPTVVVRDARGFFLAADDGVLFEKAAVGGEDLLSMPIVTVARGAAGDEVDPVGPPAPGHDEGLGDATLLSPRVLAETIRLAGRLGSGEGRIGVSEVALGAGRVAGGSPEVIAFSADGQLAVRMGWGNWDQKLDALAQVLAHAEQALPPEAESRVLSGRLDVRDPEAVVASWNQEGAV